MVAKVLVILLVGTIVATEEPDFVEAAEVFSSKQVSLQEVLQLVPQMVFAKEWT